MRHGAGWIAVLAGAGLMGGCSPAPSAAEKAAATGGSGGVASGEPRRGADARPAMDSLSASELRERAIGVLVEAAGSADAEARAHAMEGMIPVPTRLEPFARRGLTDENVGVRTVACLAIAKSGIRGMNDALKPLLADRAASVRAAATLALHRAGVAVDPSILAAMLRDPEPSVRAQAAFVLGEMGNTTALPMLRSAARDPMTRANPTRVRLLYLQLAEAMVKLGDENAIHELRAALYPARPEDLESTALAAQILGQVQDRGSASQLFYLATRTDPRAGAMPAEIRLAAAGSLARMGVADAAVVAEEFKANPSPALRAQAALVFGESGRRGMLEPLRVMLDDADPAVRRAAAAGVLKITDRPAGAGR